MLYHVRLFFFHILSSFRNFLDAQKVWTVDTYEMVEIRKNKSRSTERKDFFYGSLFIISGRSMWNSLCEIHHQNSDKICT